VGQVGAEGVPRAEIARRYGVSRGTVDDNLAKWVGRPWKQPGPKTSRQFISRFVKEKTVSQTTSTSIPRPTASTTPAAPPEAPDEE
jgi:hypothetical protein